MIAITDNDTTLVDGTDNRDDQDSRQTAVGYDALGGVATLGQVRPRQRGVLSEATNTHVIHRICIAASNSYHHLFKEPAPSLKVTFAGRFQRVDATYALKRSAGVS